MLASTGATLPEALAQDARLVQAVRVPPGSVSIDGSTRDPGWREARRYGSFVQRDPHPGAPPTEPTEVSVVYDDDALYVLVEAHDRQPQQVVGQLTRRDESSSSDWIEVWIDPNNDQLTGYRFCTNARGVKLDTRLAQGGASEDVAWDGVWDAQTRLTDRGWVAEYRIPFSELHFDPRAGSWGLQVVRRLQRANEASVLSPMPRTELRPLRHLARLQGLKDIPSPIHLELEPYGVVSYERAPRYTELQLRPGGDARVDLAPASSLHLTINPDFGQVEADPSQLNLSSFETFYAERRQFFLEQSELFDYPLAYLNWQSESLYYSRRIGAQPTRDLGLEDEEIVRLPGATTIIGASKLVGRSADGLSYGLLTAATARERALVRVGGAESQPQVAPPTIFTAARLRQEIGDGGSVVGAMATHVERVLDDEVSDVFVENATVAAVDFDLRQGDVGLVGRLLGSSLSGTAPAIAERQQSSVHSLQRPDAEHLDYDPSRTTLEGWGAELVGGRMTGAPWRVRWGGRAHSPGLDPNDLGYMRRSDTQHAFLRVDRVAERGNGVYRNYQANTAIWVDKTFGPEITGFGASFDTWWHFTNNMTSYIGTMRRQEALNVSLLRGGPAFAEPGGWDGWFGVLSDTRRAWELGMMGNFRLRDEESLTNVSIGLALRVRPTHALSISVEPRWARGVDDLQFVDGDDPDNIVLGRLHRNTAWVTTRLSVAIALGLTLEAYAMPYVSAGTYDRFYRVAAPRAARYADRIEPVVYDGDDRVQLLQLRSNLVLRYDYSLGSSAYLVWAHEQTDDRADRGDLVLERDGRTLLRAPSADVVMLKLLQHVSW